MVIFSTWGKDLNYYNNAFISKLRGLNHLKEFVHTETEYDTEAEWREETELLDEMYADTPRPHTEYDVNLKRNVIVFRPGDKFWGYLVLDFEKTSILKVGGDGIFRYHSNMSQLKVPLYMLDEFFRGDDEIPKGYVFDEGEYVGYLLYRWGDASNAIETDSSETKKKPSARAVKRKLIHASKFSI